MRQHRRGAATASHEGDLFLVVRLRSDIPKNRLSDSRLMTRVVGVTDAELLGDVGMLGEDERLSVG